MHFKVNKVEQRAGGASYVVKYDADLQLRALSDGISVEIISTRPGNATPEYVRLDAEYARRGVERNLSPRQYGALLRLSDIFIHETDFKGPRFEQFTAEAIERLLGPAAEPMNSPPNG